MKLNARQVDNAKGKDKPYKLADGFGLYLLVNPNGSKYWRLKYRSAGKEKLLAVGVYPDVKLADARKKRDDAKKILAAGGDPGTAKQDEKREKELSVVNSFKSVALEWHSYKSAKWSEDYAASMLSCLEMDVFPYIGRLDITTLQPTDMLDMLRHMEARKVLHKLKKVRQACKQIYTFAIITGKARHNPVSDLSGALQTPKLNHFLHLTADQIPAFLSALNHYTGSLLTRNGTKLLMLTGLRTIELRTSEWADIDIEKGIWQIPAERMKMRRPHIVPLSHQVKTLLEEVYQLTGRGKYVFPGRNDAGKPMSEASINQVIKRIGYDGKATGHGFRHTLSTILHEQGYNSAWIEVQLAHVDKNSIRGIYNHAQYLDGRREMLQWYADYMDSLERGENVVHGSFGKRA